MPRVDLRAYGHFTPFGWAMAVKKVIEATAEPMVAGTMLVKVVRARYL